MQAAADAKHPTKKKKNKFVKLTEYIDNNEIKINVFAQHIGGRQF